MSRRHDPGNADVLRHRRSQDFVWGALFVGKKVSDFLVIALKNTC